MILDAPHVSYNEIDVENTTIIVNAALGRILVWGYKFDNAKIISFDSFKDEYVCSANRINEFLERRKSICPNLEIIDLSRACSPDAELESNEAKRFYRFVKAIKENTDIDIVATPELEKLFPILLQKDEEEDDKLLDAYVVPLKEEKYSALQAVTKLQLAQAENNLSPELYSEILEHSNNNIVTQRVISAIDTQLSEGTEQLDKYIPTLLGCVAGRYITQDNFDAIIDIAEKYISQDNISTENINFCFGLQKESSQSEEASQRINNLIKGLIPHLPEEVRQDLDAKVSLKEKKQQEYIQKRQKIQAKVNEYSGYLILSDAVNKDLSVEQIRKVGDTIYDNAEKYPELYTKILAKIDKKHDDKEQDEYKIKAAASWIKPIISRLNTFGQKETDVNMLENLTNIVTKNQDTRHSLGHIFCQQLKENNNSDYWLNKITDLMDDNKDDHILLMNTYEDMERAYKVHPELIPESLDIFKRTLDFPEISEGFNDHLHTLASIVGDMAKEHPEFTNTAIEILSDLSLIEKDLSDSSAKNYLRSKIDDAFNTIKQNDLTPDTRRNLTVIGEKDPAVFASVVKELMSNPQTDQQLIENTIKMRINSGLDVLIDDYDSPECLKWNLAVLQSKALQNKGKEDISACAEHIFKNGVIKQLEKNPNYDPSEAFQAFYVAAPFWLKQLREKTSDNEDLLVLQHFDRIPQEAQRLYIGECVDKMYNLIATDNLKKFPKIAAKKLKLEVYNCLYSISSRSTYDNKYSLSDIEKWANVLKEIGGYSSPESCVIALNEAMVIRHSIADPNDLYSAEYAWKHFNEYGGIKQFVKISTDIIDNVFEQIRQPNNSSLVNVLKESKILISYMGEKAEKAFLAGDESYKNLWDKQMVNSHMSAYLMFDKPNEILQDMPIKEKISFLEGIGINTYYEFPNGYDWKDFPEVLSLDQLYICIRNCPDWANEDVVKAVRTFCKARIDDTSDNYSENLLSSLMMVYDAEAKKGIEDKEIFSILYKARFSNNNESMQKRMELVCKRYDLTAPQLKSLCKTSYGPLRLRLKMNTKEK